MFRGLMIFSMFLICTFIGFFLGENYKRRSIQLKEFQKGLLLLSNEIIYANTPLPDALMEVSKKVYNPISEILNDMSFTLENGYAGTIYESFEKAYMKSKEEMNLLDDDYKIISDFFKTLGSSGVTGQDKIFKIALDSIDINYKEAKKFEKENIKLYRTLGLSIGAMLAIFFI
ncbi:stage III sporulation protein SpoIIIAB [uncultured Clostridium sp.]|jgi:stage III sporulation protein AB|uniref:stage III sporulation protein SpoIIIAB n=1 Tax=uncultured Clostridium sp. TaxID=59620 RepID=UPI0025E890B3|nr:stage III sporulation protein SpoIIIAB [uncultured Clostridium sp.]